MYVGHYGIALAAKKAAPPVPLWLLFTAVQLPDLLAFTLILFGVERISYAGGDNPFYRTAIEYLPYSHSLVFNLVYAALVLVVFWKLGGRLWGVVLSLAVFSHWVIDFIFQKANMPLFFDAYPVGLGLWDYPIFSFAAEIVFVVGGAWLVLRDSRLRLHRWWLAATAALMCVYFAFIMLVPEPAAVADNPKLKALVILVPYLGFSLLAVFIDRRRRTEGAAS